MSLIAQLKKDVKGAFGEVKIDLILGRFTNESCFTVRDLLLVRDGKSNQTGNILFTTKKIYVKKSTNYSRWIYGSETGKSCTQTFYFYGKVTKSSFYNPLNQNYGHIKCLSNEASDWEDLEKSNLAHQKLNSSSFLENAKHRNYVSQTKRKNK